MVEGRRVTGHRQHHRQAVAIVQLRDVVEGEQVVVAHRVGRSGTPDVAPAMADEVDQQLAFVQGIVQGVDLGQVVALFGIGVDAGEIKALGLELLAEAVAAVLEVGAGIGGEQHAPAPVAKIILRGVADGLVDDGRDLVGFDDRKPAQGSGNQSSPSTATK